MNLFLCKNLPLTMQWISKKGLAQHQSSYRFSGNLSVCDISPSPLESNPRGTDVCKKLSQHLQCQDDYISNSVVFTMDFFLSSGDNPTSKIKILTGSVTKSLIYVFGNNVKLQMAFTNLNASEGCTKYWTTSETVYDDNQGDYAFVDSLNVSASASKSPKKPSNQPLIKFLTTGAVVVTATVFVQDCAPSGLEGNDKMRIFKKMLWEEIETGLYLIPEIGNFVKAHKCVLATHSDRFKEMINNKKRSDAEKPGSSQTVETPAMSIHLENVSEQGVRAMLAYLYFWDESEADCHVAVEKLYLGHKYKIGILETAMKNPLLAKPRQWYTADVAIKLFLFSRDVLEDGEMLKKKAIDAIKMNSTDFKDCPSFTKLFKDDHAAAMELFKCVLDDGQVKV